MTGRAIIRVVMRDEIALPPGPTALHHDATGIRAESSAVPVQAGKDSSKEDSPFQVKPFHLGAIAGVNYDCIGELVELLEGPNHK